MKRLVLMLAVLLLPLFVFAEDLVWQTDLLSQVMDVKFTNDNKYVVVCLRDSILKYDAASGEYINTIKNVSSISNVISCADLHPIENILITGGREKRLLFWDIETGDTIGSLKTEWNTTDLAIYPDGSKIITTHAVAESEDAVVWDINTKGVLAKLKLGGEGWFVKISKDSRYCLTAAMFYNEGTKQTNGVFKLWDAHTYQEIATLGNHDYWIDDIDISPDSKYAAYVGSGQIKFFNIEKRELIKEYYHKITDTVIQQMAFAPDSKKFIYAWANVLLEYKTSISNLGTFTLDYTYNYSGNPIITVSDDSKYVALSGGRRVNVLNAKWSASSVNDFENKEDIIIFPNPTTSIAQIEFLLEKPQIIKIDITDLNGQVLEIISNKEMNAGLNKVEWNSSKVTSGEYYCNITGKNYHNTFKIVVVR